MSLAAEDIQRVWSACRADPVFHVREVQGIEVVEDFQERLMRAVWAHERVAVRSCHCMGKTWTLSRLVLAIGSTFPRCKIITTAPTLRQVQLLLWSEIRTGHAASKYPLGGKLDTLKWEFAPDWWAIGFTTQKEASAGEGQANSGFQGIHGELVVVIFDEATGIPLDVWKQLEGLLTSAHVKFVALGNPTSKSTPFYGCFSDASYKKIHLSCFDSPNLRANGICDMGDLTAEYSRLRALGEEDQLKALDSYEITRPHLLTTKWVMAMALKWGLDHPLFVSKALGEFPEEDDTVLMPLGVVEVAQNREEPKETGPVFIGVDVARFGGDKSVLTRLDYPVVRKVVTKVKRDTNEVAGAVIDMVNELSEEKRRGCVITVDGTGIGAGVVDKLIEYQNENELEWQGVRIVELHFGETFKEGRDGTEENVKERSKEFANKKAEAFVKLAEDLKTEIVLPERSDFYSGELPKVIYQFDSKGRWVIEDKEKMKKRLKGLSPDYADSLALANYGRYHTGGVGRFTEEMAKPQGIPRANKLKW